MAKAATKQIDRKMHHNVLRQCGMSDLIQLMQHRRPGVYTMLYISTTVMRAVRSELTQEAQLPQRNSASAAHMEGAVSSPLPLPLWLHLCVRSNRIRNPQQTYAKRAVRKAHFKSNRAFKIIQGYPYLCRQEPRAVYCRNV